MTSVEGSTVLYTHTLSTLLIFNITLYTNDAILCRDGIAALYYKN